MSIDEAIAHAKEKAEMYRFRIKNRLMTMLEIGECEREIEEHEQLAEWLEKLKTIENIMLIYNANWYADEDNGVPDCEVLESIWNVIQDNGLDIDIEQDYRKGKSEGYNKAIDDFVTEIKTIQDQDEPLYNILWDKIAEQLKAGGEDGK